MHTTRRGKLLTLATLLSIGASLVGGAQPAGAVEVVACTASGKVQSVPGLNATVLVEAQLVTGTLSLDCLGTGALVGHWSVSFGAATQSLSCGLPLVMGTFTGGSTPVGGVTGGTVTMSAPGPGGPFTFVGDVVAGGRARHLVVEAVGVWDVVCGTLRENVAQLQGAATVLDA
jgi:hypothetical protein